MKLLNLLKLKYLIILEMAAFIYAVKSYIVNIYPRHFDQIQYLAEVYRSYEKYRLDGLMAGFKETFTNPSAQGAIYDSLALLIMMALGAGRLSALLLNIIAFIGWQIIIFYSIRKIFSSQNLAITAAALPLALSGIWQINSPGTAFDFRLDYLAMCLYGASAFMYILTDNFKNKKWSVIFSFVVALTILCRYLTVVYFLAIFLFIVPIYINKGLQLKNILGCALMVTILTLPFFIFNYELIYNYYVIGHVLGEEQAIRASGFNIFQTFWYIVQIGFIKQIGSFFYYILALILFVSTFSLLRNKSLKPDKGQLVNVNLLKAGLFFIMPPLLLLSLETQTSEVVLSILIPGFLLLIFSVVWPLLKNLHSHRPNSINYLCLILVFLITVNFCTNLIKVPYEESYRRSADEVNQVANLVSQFSQERHINNIKIGADRITDHLDAQILRVVIYEKIGVLMPLEMTLPIGIFHISDEKIMDQLKKTDIYIETNAPKLVDGFPYDMDMQANYEQIHQFCLQHMIFVKGTNIFGRSISLYVKN